MTDLRMTPETLTGHGDGSQSLAEKFGQLADLLHEAKVDDECFGPIGDAVGLSSKYFEGLDSCKELAGEAQEFLGRIKESLDETVQDYADTDQQITELLNQSGEGLA